jgi:hypothetical protein
VDVRQLRQTVVDRATSAGIRIPVARSGRNPITVTYTTGHPAYFYASLDAYRRDLDGHNVNPQYANWGGTAPLVIDEWTAEQCRAWLADRS